MVKGGMHGEGGCAWQRGGMHGKAGACVVKGGHAWQKGGMHGKGGGCAWQEGGHAWDTMRYGDTINERAVRILPECILIC